MSKPPFEFWFDFASPYGFLAGMRIEAEAAKAGIEPVYRPFMLGIVLRERGHTGTPVDNNPARAEYMWHDVARTAKRRGHGFTRPSVFPRVGVLANRVAQVAADEGWGPAFVRATYSAAFIDDREIGEPTVIGELIGGCGRSAEQVLARALSDENRALLRRNTETALAKGLFGAPHFTIGNEMFWGDDRMEEAMAWWRA